MVDDTSKDEQKTERFNMFMSPSEMKAIDDWAWQNKIRSKSEAVRRLCQIAIGLESLIPDLQSLLRDQTNGRYDVFERLEQAQTNLSAASAAADSGEIKRVVEADLDRIHDAFHKSDSSSMDLAFLVKKMADVLKSLTSGESLERSLEDMKRRARENEDYKHELKQAWEPKE